MYRLTVVKTYMLHRILFIYFCERAMTK